MLLHYTTHKHSESKTWVILVHGAGGSSAIWHKQVDEFSRNFNVLIVDIRGHGKSKMNPENTSETRYTFNLIADDIIAVLDKEQIVSAHFVGISLGTIITRQLCGMYPERVDSMILSGATMKLNIPSQLLMHFGNLVKYIVPYMWLYQLFNFAIIPKNKYKESRSLANNIARILGQKEFMRWYKLTSAVIPLLRSFRQVKLNIPTFYIMGNDDYLFTPSIRKLVKKHTNASLYVIPDCGHIVNVDQPGVFNAKAIAFLKQLSLEK